MVRPVPPQLRRCAALQFAPLVYSPRRFHSVFNCVLMRPISVGVFWCFLMIVPPVYPICVLELSRHCARATEPRPLRLWCWRACAGGHKGLSCSDCLVERRARPGSRSSSRHRVDSSSCLSPWQFIAATAASYSARGTRFLPSRDSVEEEQECAGAMLIVV